MNQTFVYRKHLRAPFVSFIIAIMLMFLGIIIMTFGILFTSQLKMSRIDPFAFGIAMLVGILFAFIIIVLEVGIFYLFLFKRFKSINITLTDDTIVYNNAKKQITIPYEDIEKLVFPSIKYTGGWVKINYRGGNIRLTVVLEHIGDFIYELKKKLDEREMTHVYNEKKMISFFKTASFSDESWERIYHNYKLQLIISYLCIIITTVILRCFNNSSNSQYFIYGSLVAPLVGYLISEIIIGVKLKKRFIIGELKLLPRNTEFEQKIFINLLMGFSIGYLLILLLIMVL